jgi:hypothetical protein
MAHPKALVSTWQHSRSVSWRCSSIKPTRCLWQDSCDHCLPVLQVIRHIAEGMVAFMLERHDHAKPIMRSVARELLSSCVLRSIMTFFTPYTVNKAGCWPFNAQSLPAANIQ